MFHHSRSKSAPCYNIDNIDYNFSIKNNNNNNNNAKSLFGSSYPVPHTPESIINWQFGDAPSQSPRRDLSHGDSLLNSELGSKPKNFALDNQFFTGGVLDWDVSIATISTAIEETKRAKEALQQSPESSNIISNGQSLDSDSAASQNEVVDSQMGIIYTSQYVGSLASTGSPSGQDEHRRCASFTCFPNIRGMNLTEEEIEQAYQPMKKKRTSFSTSPDASTSDIMSSGFASTYSPSPSFNVDPITGLTKRKKSRSLIRSSGFRGVSKCSKDGRWQARIRVGESVRYLGRFLTQEEAALCYDNAARMYHGTKAILNFKGPGDEHLTQSKKLASMAARMERRPGFELV